MEIMLNGYILLKITYRGIVSIRMCSVPVNKFHVSLMAIQKSALNL